MTSLYLQSLHFHSPTYRYVYLWMLKDTTIMFARSLLYPYDTQIQQGGERSEPTCLYITTIVLVVSWLILLIILFMIISRSLNKLQLPNLELQFNSLNGLQACALVKESKDLISRCSLMTSNTADFRWLRPNIVIFHLYLLQTI